MPETSRLYLHSPAGSDVAVYKWPLHVSDSWNEPHEIVETIRWVCFDFPELKLAVENYALNNYDPKNFESMKTLCEKYNKAVDNVRKLWSGRQPPPCIDAPPSLSLLKHILDQVYNRAITKPEELNTYQAFSPEVYGETSFELVTAMVASTHLSENDVFLDLGSGVGQIVLQVAASVGCKSYGIEKAEIPAKYAEEMNRQFIKWMDFYGKSYGDFELLKGDFLDPHFDEIFHSATVIFCNNFAFGPTLNHKLKLKFQNLRDGVKIVSSREFCPLNFRLTERNLSDIGAMMRVAELSPLKGSVSWTSKPVSYYLHKIDRTRMEEFFHKQKHPEDVKSEDGSLSGGVASSEGSSSSSEDSSLDSSEEGGGYMRVSEEMHHFPPSLSSKVPPTSSHRQTTPLFGPAHFHRSGMPSTGHTHHQYLQVGRKRQLGGTSIQRKETPPSGSTHLPRPHPQSLLNNETLPSTHRQPQGVKPRRRSNARGGGASMRGRRTGSGLDLSPLFGRFQSQMEEYIEQMSCPSFHSWVVDSIEKEKMKRKHLQGVVEHLESEVSTLSLETINTMKDSMSCLGITNLTPEGLLLGAKDIVILNRQLRKELQVLEKDVGKLKGENSMINGLCKEVDHTPSADHTHSADHTPLSEYKDGLTPPPLYRHSLQPVPFTEATLTSDMLLETEQLLVIDSGTTPIAPPTTNETNQQDLPVGVVTNSPAPVVTLDLNSDSTQVHVTTMDVTLDMSNDMGVAVPPSSAIEVGVVSDPPVSSALSVVGVTSDYTLFPSNETKPTSCLTVEEEYKVGTTGGDYTKYQITLETIDQAVLELGPFAKDVVRERPDLPPLHSNWSPLVDTSSNNVGVANKKDRKKPYSPPTSRVVRKGRGDCASPLSSVGSPMGVEPRHAPQRRGKKKPQQQVALESDSSPLVINDLTTGSDTMATDVGGVAKSNVTTPTQETSAVEAMLALSNVRQTDHTHSNELHCPPKVHYPSLNKLSEATPTKKGMSHHGSSSSVRSSGEETKGNSPYVPLPQSLSVPPRMKSPSLESTKPHPSKALPTDDRINPFWPVSTVETLATATGGYPYPLMSLSPWGNTVGAGLHPTYLSSFPTPSRPETTPTIDIATPARSNVVPPYYFYNHTYPFAAGGLATPFTNQLISSAPPTLQSPTVSSPLINQPLPYPFIATPTIHPLGDALKSAPKDNLIQPQQQTAPWVVLGGPQGNFLNANQFTGLGVASPQLSLFPGLQQAGITSLLGGGGAMLQGGGAMIQGGEQLDIKRLLETTPIPRPSSRGLVPLSDPHHSRNPSHYGTSPVGVVNTGKRDKVDKRKKLKIHQIQTEDFSDKGIGRGNSDRKVRKITTEWEVPTVYCSPAHSLVKPVVMDTSSVVKATPTPLPGSRHTASPVVVPVAHLPTLVTMSSEENEHFVQVDDEASSEGTVSVALSPDHRPMGGLPVTSPPPQEVSGHNTEGPGDENESSDQYTGSSDQYRGSGDLLKGSGELVSSDQYNPPVKGSDKGSNDDYQEPAIESHDMTIESHDSSPDPLETTPIIADTETRPLKPHPPINENEDDYLDIHVNQNEFDAVGEGEENILSVHAHSPSLTLPTVSMGLIMDGTSKTTPLHRMSPSRPVDKPLVHKPHPQYKPHPQHHGMLNEEKHQKPKHDDRQELNRPVYQATPTHVHGRYQHDSQTPPPHHMTPPVPPPKKPVHRDHTHYDKDHTHYDRRSHSSGPFEEYRHVPREEHPLWTTPNSHTLSRHANDTGQLSRKRPDEHIAGAEGEGGVAKRHKIKRPKGSAHHTHSNATH